MQISVGAERKSDVNYLLNIYLYNFFEIQLSIKFKYTKFFVVIGGCR